MLVSVHALHNFSHGLAFVLVQKMHYLFNSTHKLLQSHSTVRTVLAIGYRTTCMYKRKQAVLKQLEKEFNRLTISQSLISVSTIVGSRMQSGIVCNH